jgi:spore cortex formation protein SpoVR/YcgB (stage V sporulation)
MEDKEIRELEKAVEQIWEVARRFGLDPYPTNFEIVPATVMYEVGSYALPGRYSHWTFGKTYHRMKTMYDFGLSKIYEVVINTNPAYGFLLETNSPIQNKMVIAHVLGHVDFFKNNTYFATAARQSSDFSTPYSRSKSTSIRISSLNARFRLRKRSDASSNVPKKVATTIFGNSIKANTK